MQRLTLNNLIRPRPAQRLVNTNPPRRPFFPKSSNQASMSSAPSAAETDAQAESVANTSGITTESLRKIIAEKLEANHVDIEDMSGENQTMP